jgi:hypothetical protein
MYLHGRAPGYDWEWERFAAEYGVFDALYSIWCSQRPFKGKTKHSLRFGRLCRRYRVKSNRGKVRLFVRLRNDFTHEVLWDRATLGSAATIPAFHAAYWLHNLNSRLILAVLGIRGQYVRSGWWGMGNSIWHID